MSRTFNITADCKPSLHYMVDITDRLEQIKKMIDAGQYFTINRARQYGKNYDFARTGKISGAGLCCCKS